MGVESPLHGTVLPTEASANSVDESKTKQSVNELLYGQRMPRVLACMQELTLTEQQPVKSDRCYTTKIKNGFEGMKQYSCIMAIICLGTYYIFTVAIAMLNEWVKYNHYDGKDMFYNNVSLGLLL